MGSCYQALGIYEEALKFYEKGKAMTERMMPDERETYKRHVDKKILEVRNLIAKSHSNEEAK
jgi:hypothetical protein